jgi:uroporphyrinogen-III synthase
VHGLAADAVWETGEQDRGRFGFSRVLLAAGHPDDLAWLERLAEAGVLVEPFILYQLVESKPDEEIVTALQTGKVDLAVYFSGEDFRMAGAQLNKLHLAEALRHIPCICPDENTAGILRESGIKVISVTGDANPAALVEAAIQWRRRS